MLKTGTYTDPVTRWGALRTALLLAALAAATPATLDAQAIQRSMYVSVLNEADAPVLDLGPSDFVIREDNVAREVLRVAPADEPMQIAVVIDNSEAARDSILDMRRALQEFVTAMTAPQGQTSGRNQLAFVTLGDRPTIITDYTTDRARLLTGVERLFAQPDSGNYLLDGLIEVCRGLGKRDAPRPVIIAITTEGPEFSSRHYDLVLDPLRASGAAFHALVVGPASADNSEDARNRATVLDRGTRSTGGRYEQVLTSMALSRRLKELGTDLTHQYRVTWAHPRSLIPPEQVTVSVKRPGLSARGTLVKDRQTGGRW